MQVNLNIRPVISVKSDARPVPPRSEAKAVDHATFDKTAALERALRDEPEARPEAVARGEAMSSSAQYPPMEGIRGISRLLAASWPTSLE